MTLTYEFRMETNLWEFWNFPSTGQETTSFHQIIAISTNFQMQLENISSADCNSNADRSEQENESFWRTHIPMLQKVSLSGSMHDRHSRNAHKIFLKSDIIGYTYFNGLMDAPKSRCNVLVGNLSPFDSIIGHFIIQPHRSFAILLKLFKHSFLRFHFLPTIIEN